MSKTLKIVCISDTHAQTYAEGFPEIPNGDILLHAGDFTYKGQKEHVFKFNEWLGTLSHRHKIVIAGNHEKIFDSKLETNPEVIEDMRKLLTNCVYLEESEVTVFENCWKRSYMGKLNIEFSR